MSVSSSTSATSASSSSLPSSSSSSQYLTPEFFPSSAIDAKNSPLALLVQTCSSIGRDSQATKSSSGDKKESSSSSSTGNSHNNASSSSSGKDHSSRLKSSSPPEKATKSSLDDRRKTSFHNGADHKKESHKSSSSGVNSSTKSSPNKSCFRAPGSSTDRNSNNHDKYSNGLYSYGLDKYAHPAINDENNASLLGSSSANARLFSAAYSNGISGKLNGNYPYLDTSPDYLSKNHFYPLYNSMKLQEAAALQNAANFSPSSTSLGSMYPSFLNYPLSLDPLAAAAVAYSANLAAAAQVAAASQRKSSPSGGTHASGILRRCSGSCKDPFCPGQHSTSNPTPSLTSHSPASQHCTNSGCSQCSEKSPPHHTNPNSLNPTSSSLSAAASSLFYPGCPSVPGSSFCLPPFNPLLVPGGLTSSLLNSTLGCSPSQPQSLICNWVQGGEYCGKRFSTSEELLIHLHGHTTTSSSQPPSNQIDLVHQKQLQSLAPFNPSALPPLPFPLPNYFGSNGSRTLSSSRKTPPLSYSLPLVPSHQRNSISPNSLLSSARYHPYKSPSLSVTPPGLGSSVQQNLLPSSFPSLAAYYSPYAVYNQRLNAAVVGP